ncbi:MAG TPA: FoF1 ATP synthase subunit gamma, partial [Bacteroidia bacterium]|nr:FoF1 ATP synthase subunit gamma [Bacteroidia bacterium]
AVAERFLPIESHKPGHSKSKVDYLFEPNQEYIVNELIPKSLKTQFYKALLDSVASEHGARMTAMHKATDNAKVMLRDLKISYNKARQAAITNEILEIVGGAEALKG